MTTEPITSSTLTVSLNRVFRPSALLLSAGNRGGAQRREPDQRDQHQTAQSALQRVRPLVTRHPPDHVHRVLHRLGHPQAAVDRAEDTEKQGDPAAADPARVGQFRAHHRELADRRREDLLLQVRAALEQEVQDRGQHQ